MLFAILTAILAYRKAKETGRNGALWAIAGAAVFIGTQLAVSVGIGMFLGLGQVLWGWDDAIYVTYDPVVRIVAIAASLFASWLLLRFLGRTPTPEPSLQAPPPPPSFGGDQ